MAISNVYNLASQQLLNNSANLGYIARAGARNGTTPEDRRLDYFWRDAFMTVVTAYFMELCSRAVDANYSSPKMTEVLQLNKLAALYQKQIQKIATESGGDKLGNDALKKVNFDGLDKKLHHRFLTQQLSASNYGLVPDLLQQDLHGVLKKSANELTADERLKQIQAKVVVPHLQRRLNYQQLLVSKDVPAALAEKWVNEVNKGWFDEVQDKLFTKAGIKTRNNSAGPLHELRKRFYELKDEGKYMKVWQPGDPKEQELLKDAINEVVAEKMKGLTPETKTTKAYFDKVLADYQKLCPNEKEIQQAKMPAALKSVGNELHDLPDKAEDLFKEALHARYTQMALKKVKNSGDWPKIALMLASNIMYFGVVGNWMDFNVIQPFQKKISDERGGVKELIAPAYGAIIPGALTVVGMSKWVMPKVPMLAKMGPAMQFLIAGTTGMGVYVASSYAMVMGRLANLRMKDKLNPEKQNPQAAKQNPAPASQSQGAQTAPAMTVSAALQSPRMPLPQPGFPPMGFPTGGASTGGFKPAGFGTPQPQTPFSSGFSQPAVLPNAFGLPRFGQQGAPAGQLAAEKRKLPRRQG